MRLKNKISKLIDVIKDTDINEIEISSFWGAQKIKLRKKIQSQVTEIAKNKNEHISEHINIPIEKNTKQDNVEDDKDTSVIENDNSEKITAPLVGTFYESPKPGESPFINVGDTVEVGQSLCIIEAMKIFNTIETDYSGEITEILVKDGQPVEFGQPLFKFIKE